MTTAPVHIFDVKVGSGKQSAIRLEIASSHDSLLEGRVRCELVSEFLESIKKGPNINIYRILIF